MKLLLTAAGISNPSIRNALVELLGKPVEESSALFIPTAIYALRNGADIARRVICGSLGDPFCNMGWKSLGVLELTALPSIKKEHWLTLLGETDALLVGGGDCQYLCYWMQKSGLADLLPSLLRKTVYVGLSAGSMVMTSLEQPMAATHCRPKLADRWDYLILHCTRTWIMNGSRKIHWPTSKNWQPPYQSRHMQLTIKPPLKLRTAPLKSYPKDTGSYLIPELLVPACNDR